MRPVPAKLNEIYSTFRERLFRENTLYPDRLLLIPSLATFYRWADKLNDEERIESQVGRRAAEQKYLALHEGPVETVPMGAVEIDHTLIDVHVVDEHGIVLGRPTLSVAIDRATRMCVGYVITWEPPSYQSVMLLLRHVIKDKQYVKQNYKDIICNDWPCFGLPRVIIVDNGAEFHSKNLVEACLQLGRISLEYTPTRAPRYKGMVERFFRSLNDGLLHLLPGTTLSRVDRESHYDSRTTATITLRKLHEVMHRYIVDIYSVRFHRGLKDIPLEAWTRSVARHPLRLPATLQDLDILSCGIERRTLGRQGIELFSLFYQSAELAQLRVQKNGKGAVDVRYDPTDIGRIWVFDAGLGRHIAVPCRSTTYAPGRTIWQHEKILQHLAEKKRGATENDLHRAVAELRRSIDASAQKRSPRTRLGKRAARFREQPKAPNELVPPPAACSLPRVDDWPTDDIPDVAPTQPLDAAVHSDEAPRVRPAHKRNPADQTDQPSHTADLEEYIRTHRLNVRELP